MGEVIPRPGFRVDPLLSNRWNEVWSALAPSPKLA